MKWIYDSSLIIRQIITWTILLGIWGAIIYMIIRYVPGKYVAIVLGIIAIPIIIQFFFSDKIVLKSLGARIITESDDPRLYTMVRKLARKANLPMPKVAIVNTTMPNAFATGWSKSHSVVGVTRGIYSYLNDQELETVIAHELSHVKNADVVTLTISSFLSTVSMLILMVIAFGAKSSESRNENALFALGKLIIILLAFVIAGILYLLTILLTRFISRYRELAADRGSVLITGDGNTLIRALQKIETGVDATPEGELPKSSTCNHYYIIPAAIGSSFFNLFSTHPTLQQRIKNIKTFSRLQEQADQNTRKIPNQEPPSASVLPGTTTTSTMNQMMSESSNQSEILGRMYFNRALDNLIGTESTKPNMKMGKYYLNKAREVAYPDALALLSNPDREAAVYLAGAKNGNEIAWNKLEKWYCFKKNRLSDETWKEIGRLKRNR